VVEKDAASILADLRPQMSTMTNSVLGSLDIRMTRNAKLETPILQTDHELDVIHFRKHFKPCIADLKLPLEDVDDDNDESLVWPANSHNIPTKLMTRVKAEKLKTSRDTLLLLQQVVKKDWPIVDETRIWDEALSCHRVRVSLTPKDYILIDKV
jgi:hypothetical protein